MYPGTNSSPSHGLPYEIPTINTESNYNTIFYIDPSRSSNGNGSINSPFNVLPSNLQQNTAYLIKRGTTHPGINRRFVNVLIGAYGSGSQPVITGGLVVQNNSSNSTIRDLDITNQGTWARVIEFNHQNSSQSITVAYCKIRGVKQNGRYPQYAIHHAVDGLVLFNNEIFNIDNNGWWLTPHSNIKVVRNWIHNVNKGGENNGNNSGDGIQAEYGLNGMYFAGNIIDKSNSMWKYALMLNGQQNNNVFEYNTFYAPKAGAGGAAVRWLAHQGGIFRKNLVRSIGDNGSQLVTPFDTWGPHANKAAPYGIRDNHILRVGGSINNVATNGVVISNCNKVFQSISEYNSYKANNPALYGSDITSANFWDQSHESNPSFRRSLARGISHVN
jgi:hypothetical protein